MVKSETMKGETTPEFDLYADDYDAACAQGLAATGEDKDYFARGRVRWLASEFARRNEPRPRSVLDFGCGTGSATPHLIEELGVERVLGVDVSSKSLNVARRNHGGRAEFRLLEEQGPEGEFDLAYTSGVFHHIPVAERAGAVEYVFRALRPGGLYAFWENSPWNPGTRFVMSRCPFDKDAVMLSPPEARTLLGGGGFRVERTNFLFIFPSSLRFLRWLEPPLARLPLGGQYLVLCRKA